MKLVDLVPLKEEPLKEGKFKKEERELKNPRGCS